ncbi:hypothetical protein [Streptomyces sp. NPDC029526]|uniref:hypothetical protein n=1 Tax=Streptomyces sp. NPDC029526 TaxID=3155728 RepID=UPI0033EAAC76
MNAVTGKRLRRALAWTVGGLLLAGAAVTARGLWEGEPYPAADPDRVAVRLKDHAQQVLDEAALPRDRPAPARVDTSACYYRGLSYLAHFDQSRRDVYGFTLNWRVTEVPEAAARRAQEPTRRRLERDGWELRYERDPRAGFGFVFADPRTGEAVDVAWYRPTGTYAVSVSAPCGTVPDGFDAYDWPAAAWTPARAGRPGRPAPHGLPAGVRSDERPADTRGATAHAVGR